MIVTLLGTEMPKTFSTVGVFMCVWRGEWWLWWMLIQPHKGTNTMTEQHVRVGLKHFWGSCDANELILALAHNGVIFEHPMRANRSRTQSTTDRGLTLITDPPLHVVFLLGCATYTKPLHVYESRATPDKPPKHGTKQL